MHFYNMALFYVWMLFLPPTLFLKGKLVGITVVKDISKFLCSWKVFFEVIKFEL